MKSFHSVCKLQWNLCQQVYSLIQSIWPLFQPACLQQTVWLPCGGWGCSDASWNPCILGIDVVFRLTVIFAPWGKKKEKKKKHFLYSVCNVWIDCVEQQVDSKQGNYGIWDTGSHSTLALKSTWNRINFTK